MPKQLTYSLPLSDSKLSGLHFNSSIKSPHPPILALHGWLDNAMSFAPLAKKLDEYEIIALEFPGHGHSSHGPSGRGYQWIEYVSVIYEWIETYMPSPFVLMGHSLGAGVAGLVAGLRPQNLAKIIFIEGLGILTQDENNTPEQFLRYYAARKRQRKTPKTYASIEEAILARQKAGDLTKEAAEILVSRNIKQKDQNTFLWHYDERLKWPSPIRLSNKQADAFLKKIDRKSLLIHAKDSALFKPDTWLLDKAKLVQNITLHKENEGGHHLHMTRPDGPAGAIKNFLKAP